MSRVADPVTVVEYSEAWPRMFAALELELIAGSAGLRIIVEHIGSTAVPGLAAKPVIDVLLGVEDAVDLALLPGRLSVLGFDYQPEHEEAVPFRRFFVRRNRWGERTAHLHAVVAGGEFWRDHILFRDALRADEGLRRSYAELKVALAVKCAGNREAYTRGKDEFVRRVLRTASDAAAPRTH